MILSLIHGDRMVLDTVPDLDGSHRECSGGALLAYTY
jgi:hypothetical protein